MFNGEPTTAELTFFVGVSLLVPMIAGLVYWEYKNKPRPYILVSDKKKQ
ncbi:Protein of unknown function [Pyronema omphalodes CBS 100304]|uniref:Uncharacterized protein n=1 Tax=Pyronema omphalodes (strain CBS 100304) TaxID=1076935 RepID=U4LTN3_PYROM|nr:Protein of unknown function [Pyronema omphalodes CBS 100304]